MYQLVNDLVKENKTQCNFEGEFCVSVIGRFKWKLSVFLVVENPYDKHHIFDLVLSKIKMQQKMATKKSRHGHTMYQMQRDILNMIKTLNSKSYAFYTFLFLCLFFFFSKF